MAEKKGDKNQKGDPEGTDAIVVDKDGKRVMPKALDLKVDLDRLELDEVTVEVENLRASLDLKVSVANFVNVQASASAHLGKTSVEVKGLDAEAHLGVDINNVTRVVETSVGALGIGLGGVGDGVASILTSDDDGEAADTLLEALGVSKASKKK